MQRIYWLAEDRLVSHEGLCSMEQLIKFWNSIYMPTLFSPAHIELLSKYSAPCTIDVAILVAEDALPIQHSF